MPEMIHECAFRVVDADGRSYVVRAYAEPQREGRLWEGWLEFHDPEARKTLRTERETTQRTLEDVRYWADGLQPVFLEGAFKRAAQRKKRARRRRGD
jgi:hypothetical protein